jgi:hypothetical protein
MKSFKILVYFLIVSLASCNSPSNEDKNKNASKTDSSKTTGQEKPVISYDKKYDNISSFIAGIQPQSAEEFSKFDSTTNWKSFSGNMDSIWKILDEKRFSKMKEWKNKELADVNKSIQYLFYPFSGPDYLNADMFFHEANTFCMIGLENVGALPDLTSMKPAEVNTYLNSVNGSLNDLFKKSYFITKNMLNDLSKNKVNGTLPLMCVFLKRTGHIITNIEYVGVDSLGNEIVRDDAAPFRGSKGVRVSFMVPGSGKVKKLYYYKSDLSDAGLKQNKGFHTYLTKLDTVVTYLKAASHLLHYGSFSTIRNIILDKSTAVLQDDSGISYKFFDKTKWDVKLYGKYRKAVKDFSGVDQPDLKKAYEADSTIQPVPFVLGYHWGNDEINLQLATRKK